MYHRIAAERFDPWGLAVTPANFRDQVAWLREHRTVLPLPEFARRQSARTLDRNAIAITFDDGYACNLEVAAPILRLADAAATIFVVADAIDKGGEFWWDELARLILELPQSTVEIALPDGVLRLDLGERLDADRDWLPDAPPGTARQQAFHQCWSALREIESDQQQAALAQLRAIATGDEGTRGSHRPMSREEVRALHCGLIEVGAHSLSHTSLTARTRDDQAKEIAGSQRFCAGILGTAPASFAYPFGDFDDNSARLVEQAGFSAACTTVCAPVGPADSAFALPRLRAGNWTSSDLARQLRSL